MIPTLFFLGMIVLTPLWVFGLFRAWKGRPAIALWSSMLACLLSVGTFLSTYVLPRYADWSFGGMGAGDGMALIGLMMFAGLAAFGSMIAILITGLTYAVRRQQDPKVLKKDIE